MMSPYSLTHEVTGLEIIQCVWLMQKTITACFIEIGGNRVSGISSVGRVPALHAGGQEFESPMLHEFYLG